jgi:hypothetical protein
VSYGDEVGAKELIHPRTLGNSSIEVSELDVPYSKAKLQALFSSIGYRLSEADFEMIFELVSPDGDRAPIGAFSSALNAFVDGNY